MSSRLRGLFAGRSARRHWALLSLCAAAVLLIPLEWVVAGGAAWLAAAVLVLRDGDAAFRRRLLLLLGVLLVLAAAPIDTNRNTGHIVALGIPFLAVVVGPALILGRTDPGVIRFRFWPRRFRLIDVVYTVISIPLAYGIIQFYFFQANPELPTHWPLPPVQTQESFWRLFAGINAVGIWDELFFVNTVYALLRSQFGFRAANLAQAVIYASVLSDMAFTGIGPFLVFGFALTQGAMFEESENLLYVLIVHIIVDYFLVAAILQYHYPGHVPGWF